MLVKLFLKKSVVRDNKTFFYKKLVYKKLDPPNPKDQETEVLSQNLRRILMRNKKLLSFFKFNTKIAKIKKLIKRF